MNPLDLVKLTALMELTVGRPEIAIGLLDGPVAIDHPDLQKEAIRAIPGKLSAACAEPGNAACGHGTFVAGILTAKRASAAPAICPECTLLLRPIFSEAPLANGELPSATPDELAKAIIEAIDAGARVLNLSAALAYPSSASQRSIQEALGYALMRGVIVVAAAGNQSALGSTTITRHPWTIPVVSYDLQGIPLDQSNLGSSIGKRGLGAPGNNITSLGTRGASLPSGGTSVAAPFVTGAIALLWSEFPEATAAQIKFAVTTAQSARRTTIIPPLLNAWRAYQAMKNDLKR
jgi:subtilisin family serine protease